MIPTTTALTVFKATLSTQSKDLSSKNKNSNENNPTLHKAGVDTASVPKATAPSGEAELEDTRPSPPGLLSPEGTNPLSHRDERAYEHERHRVKHARDWSKRRARKATKGLIGGTGIGRAGATRAERRAKSRKGGLDVDVDVDVYAVNPQGHTDRLAVELLKKASLSPSGDGGYDASKAIPGVKLNLSEIMMLSQRKPRKLNVDDFEVIPHIRSVIALDDTVNEHDVDLDESWEHIYANNGEGKASDGKFGRPSYARVAGTGCQ